MSLRRIAAATAWALLATGGAGVAAELPPNPRLGTCGSVSGGFLLPGTDACLTVGGFVRVEGGWTSAAPPPAVAGPWAGARLTTGALQRPAIAVAGLDRSTLGPSGRLTADLRLPSDLGPVRIFVSLRGYHGLATTRAAR